MKTNFLRLFCLIFLIISAAANASAGVNLDLGQKMTLDNPPLDVVSTPDGKFMFVLTEDGSISVFDQKGVLQNRINVGYDVSQIKMDPKGTRLFITSRSNKSVQIISLDFFVEINTAGSPSKGPENAPVVFAVFSDFQ